MRKALFTAMICTMTATSAIFAQQHQQSMAFTGPTNWVPGTPVTLNIFLTINYNAYGLSYWLEVPNAIAPFLTVTAEGYHWPPNTPPWTGMDPFNVNGRPGHMQQNRDLGAADLMNILPPGTTYLADITISLAAGAPSGSYAMYTTYLNPHPSIVTDTQFNDNPLGPENPAGGFVFNVVPEPSTLVLVGIGAIGAGLLIYRRRKHCSGATDQCG